MDLAKSGQARTIEVSNGEWYMQQAIRGRSFLGDLVGADWGGMWIRVASSIVT